MHILAHPIQPFCVEHGTTMVSSFDHNNVSCLPLAHADYGINVDDNLCIATKIWTMQLLFHSVFHNENDLLFFGKEY
jgi:hypothetical protein